MQSTSSPKTIQAQQVTEAQFRALLSRNFATAAGKVEEYVRAFVPGHSKVNWRYCELSNGGFYAAPDLTPIYVSMGLNQTVEMSTDAVGIASSLFALWDLGRSDPSLSDYYQRLQAFADQHAEAEVIRFAATNPSAVAVTERTVWGPPDFTVSLDGREVGVVVGMNQALEFFDLDTPDKILDDSTFTDEQREDVEEAWARYRKKSGLDVA